MVTKKLLKAFCLFLLFLSVVQVKAQTTIPATNKVALTNLANQIKSFPQEKLYIQLDKPYYSAGERLWFRAYIIHAALHIPMNFSRYIYLELLNSDNEVVVRKKIRPVDNMHFGQLDLSPELAKGWYSLRAYTNYMRNIDEDWFFRRYIFIGNSLQRSVVSDNSQKPEKKKSSDKKAVKEEIPYVVKFFPEGENLVAGNMQMIGFNSRSSEGLSVEISGRIVDQDNKEACTFKTSGKGFGVTAFVPIAGKTYTAICEDNQGRSTTINLPAVSEKDISLSIQQNANIIVITPLLPNASSIKDSLFLIAHQRGVPVMQKVLTSETPSITVSKDGMYSGMTQFILLNARGKMLSERIIFVSGKDKVELSFTTDKKNYGKRDAVNAKILVKDSKGNPVKGNFSVSVTDDSDVKINPDDQTIESYLLLQSDINYPLEKPNSFFRKDNKQSSSELDVLMMTNKWPRYDIKSVLSGVFARGDTFALEIGSTLTGKVRTFPGKRPLSDVNVTMLVQKRMHVDAAVTNKDGKYYFEAFEFPDSTEILLQAEKSNPFITLVPDKDSFPEVKINPVPQPEILPEKDLKTIMEKRRNKYFYDNGMMVINLDKVEIVAKKEDRFKELRKDRGAAYFSPSYTIGEEKLSTAGTLMDVLIMAPGITMDQTGSGVLMRNRTPLIMVDNIEYTMEELNTINPSEVKMIDLLKDPSETAIFGSQGQNGVICIYLKRGEDLFAANKEPKPWQAVITPLGYAIPHEFRMPEYFIEDQKLSSIPDLRSTIYWKPNVQSNENGEADLMFYTADASGTYTVTIEGITPNGEIINYVGKLNRK